MVKKPKLDKHGSMCHSAFTCIDCSKTFQGPAQWKSHTSCISEAEKYQGNLYKGPKGVSLSYYDRYSFTHVHKQQEQNGGPRSNGNARAGQRNSNVPASNYQPWSYNGGSQGGRPTWGKQYTRNEATGANVTPLGTPLRMSPISTPVSLPDSPSNTPPDASASKASSKPTESKVEEKSKKDKKSRKEKKRKASDEEVRSCTLLLVVY